MLAENDNAEDFLIGGNGILLFCEPYLSDAVKLAHDEPEKDHISIDINLNADYDKLVHLFKEIISTQNHVPALSWETSQALYKPSVSPKNIKIDNLKQTREVYTLVATRTDARASIREIGLCR